MDFKEAEIFVKDANRVMREHREHCRKMLRKELISDIGGTIAIAVFVWFFIYALN